jgi:FixJ family two-component response regulator
MVQGLGSGVKEVTSTAKGIICVVDDDRFFLEALVRLLRAARLETVSFENPWLFLDYVKDHSVSLAIIDLQMPELSGLEVQQRLYEIAPEVAVIIITGNASATDREVALARGAIAFLLKPIRRDELLDAVRKAIQL